MVFIKRQIFTCRIFTSLSPTREFILFRKSFPRRSDGFLSAVIPRPKAAADGRKALRIARYGWHPRCSFWLSMRPFFVAWLALALLLLALGRFAAPPNGAATGGVRTTAARNANGRRVDMGRETMMVANQGNGAQSRSKPVQGSGE
jgi:hypothetical protein